MPQDYSIVRGNGSSPIWTYPTGVDVSPPMVAPDTLALAADTVYFCGIWPFDTEHTLDRLGVWVTSAGDGSSVVRLGTAVVADGVVVGETLTEHGSIDGTSASLQRVSDIGLSIDPGTKLALFVLTNGESTTAPTVRSGTPFPFGVEAHNGADAARGRGAGWESSATHSGAMPATVPASASGLPNLPTVIARFS